VTLPGAALRLPRAMVHPALWAGVLERMLAPPVTNRLHAVPVILIPTVRRVTDFRQMAADVGGGGFFGVKRQRLPALGE